MSNCVDTKAYFILTVLDPIENSLVDDGYGGYIWNTGATTPTQFSDGDLLYIYESIDEAESDDEGTIDAFVNEMFVNMWADESTYAFLEENCVQLGSITFPDPIGFNTDEGESITWTINNKVVQSLVINNKEVQSIVRVSDNAILYQKSGGTPTPVWTNIFHDDCNVDNTSQYTTFVGSGGTFVTTYNSKNVRYQVVTLANTMIKGYAIPLSNIVDNFRIKLDMMFVSINNANMQIGIGIVDVNYSPTHYDFYYLNSLGNICYVQDNSIINTSTTSVAKNVHFNLEFEKQGSTAICKVYDENMNLLSTTTQTTNTYQTGYLFFGQYLPSQNGPGGGALYDISVEELQ
jgi:hypothetical protein